MNTNEKTMARWAHTSCDGTPPIGSYMALAQAVSNSPWQAQVLREEIGFPKTEHMPLLAHVRFDDEPEEKQVTASNFFNELICGIQARNQGHAVLFWAAIMKVGTLQIQLLDQASGATSACSVAGRVKALPKLATGLIVLTPD